MRRELLRLWPSLSSSIHLSDGAGESEPETSAASADAREWNHADAEHRLGTVFERHGFNAWAGAALTELETEARVERRKREELLRASAASGA
jgi:hypothetical protein